MPHAVLAAAASSPAPAIASETALTLAASIVFGALTWWLAYRLFARATRASEESAATETPAEPQATADEQTEPSADCTPVDLPPVDLPPAPLETVAIDDPPLANIDGNVAVTSPSAV